MSIVVLWTAYERWHAWVMLSGGVAHDYRNYRNHTALFERRGCGTQPNMGKITHGVAQSVRDSSTATARGDETAQGELRVDNR